ncbi:MAG: peptidoglycan DD-metalloendopeptidase family protein [Lachnospiraceae bacterium]|nr:peptidoglycan DD-metalloendopeptidase family protein [Lachnospiraceae bacterium]
MPNFREGNSRDMRVAVTLNQVMVGTLSSKEEAQSCLREARRIFARERLGVSATDGALALSDAELSVTNVTRVAGADRTIDDAETVTMTMLSVLRSNIHATLGKHYTVKIGDYSVNLADADEVLLLLDTALHAYDPNGLYRASLILEPTREVNVLTARVDRVSEVSVDEEESGEAGAFLALSQAMQDKEKTAEEMDFSEFELGLYAMNFADRIEVVEAYLPESELTDVQTAIDEVTKDKETPQIYEVKSGDSLSVIAERFGLTVETILSMNEALENEATTIRPEDEIIVTVPEPELSVRYETTEYIEEAYEAEPVIVPNDEWYSNKSVTLQEPSSGYHKIIAKTTYLNNSSVSREVVKEEVTWEPVPKIIERGTKAPPTYIKPISGGRMSSGFGRRSQPKKGASTYHKGIDWATPVGTAVVASSSGVVTKAGWGSGYGYVVYIAHPDGKVTRYGHLSKILVKSGQSVSQGQKIALSGNTGVSTGPHIHFEILVNGAQVNPLKYLN